MKPSKHLLEDWYASRRWTVDELLEAEKAGALSFVASEKSRAASSARSGVSAPGNGSLGQDYIDTSAERWELRNNGPQLLFPGEK